MQVKTNLNKKVGVKAIFFSITSSDSIVFRWVFEQISRGVKANFTIYLLNLNK